MKGPPTLSDEMDQQHARLIEVLDMIISYAERRVIKRISLLTGSPDLDTFCERAVSSLQICRDMLVDVHRSRGYLTLTEILHNGPNMWYSTLTPKKLGDYVETASSIFTLFFSFDAGYQMKNWKTTPKNEAYGEEGGSKDVN